MENDRYQRFGLPKWSIRINHLSYADDIIIFASAENESLQLTIDTLKEYDKVSGQLINT